MELPTWHLPPLARLTKDGIDFMPFILYDEVTIDKLAFECMLGARASLQRWQPSKDSVAILESLARDGHIVLEDYAAGLDDPEISSLLDQIISYDLSDPNIVLPCRESLRLWIQFYKDLFGATDYELLNFHDMISNLKGEADAKDAFSYLYECIADINRILILSHKLEKPIYEWEDYNQFYKYKFLRTGQIRSSRPSGQTLHELFDIFIPDFDITDYSQLVDTRHDKRLAAVRKLASDLGETPISKDLVVQACEDVLKVKEGLETFSKYTGIVGVALNLLPGPVGDAFQFVANSIYKRWRERNIKWQAFFVERAIQYTKTDAEAKLRQQR
jgi:hypothetical protein